MKLEYIRDGKIKITAQTKIKHNGRTYKGSEIDELVATTFPPEKRVYRSKSEKRRIEAQIVEPTDEEILKASEVYNADENESGERVQAVHERPKRRRSKKSARN